MFFFIFIYSEMGRGGFILEVSLVASMKKHGKAGGKAGKRGRGRKAEGVLRIPMERY